MEVQEQADTMIAARQPPFIIILSVSLIPTPFLSKQQQFCHTWWMQMKNKKIMGVSRIVCTFNWTPDCQATSKYVVPILLINFIDLLFSSQFGTTLISDGDNCMF